MNCRTTNRTKGLIRRPIVAALVLIACMAEAFSPDSLYVSRVIHSRRYSEPIQDKPTAKTEQNQIEWGVSYIGGDPCGSKLNDDPFDAAKSSKPGMPEDMKARIAALAEQKKRQAKQEREER